MSGTDHDVIASRLRQTMKKPFKPPFKSSFALAPAGEDEDTAASAHRPLSRPVSRAPSPAPYRADSPVAGAIPKAVPSVDMASGTDVIEIDSESDEETSVLPSTPLPPTDIEVDASFSTKFPVSSMELLWALP